LMTGLGRWRGFSSVWRWMLGFVKTNLGPARQFDHRYLSPSFVPHNPTLHSLLAKKTHGCLQIVAHQEEAVSSFFFERLDGMNRHFGGWQSENQPAVPGIHMPEPENVTEEFAIGLGVGAVKDDMSPRNGHPISGRPDRVLTAQLSTSKARESPFCTQPRLNTQNGNPGSRPSAAGTDPCARPSQELPAAARFTDGLEPAPSYHGFMTSER